MLRSYTSSEDPLTHHFHCKVLCSRHTSPSTKCPQIILSCPPLSRQPPQDTVLVILKPPKIQEREALIDHFR